MMDQTDLYGRLGLTKDATPEQIKKVFRKLAKEWHPDVNKEEGARNIWNDLLEAYVVLSDPEQKEHYDRTGKINQINRERFDRSKAITTLQQTFSRLISENIGQDEKDLLTAARIIIKQAKTGTSVKIAQMTSEKGWLVSRLEVVDVSDSKVPNLYVAALNDMIDTLNEDLDSYESDLRAIEIILNDLLPKYKYSRKKELSVTA